MKRKIIKVAKWGTPKKLKRALIRAYTKPTTNRHVVNHPLVR
jgi:hypothetical protein